MRSCESRSRPPRGPNPLHAAHAAVGPLATEMMLDQSARTLTRGNRTGRCERGASVHRPVCTFGHAVATDGQDGTAIGPPTVVRRTHLRVPDRRIEGISPGFWTGTGPPRAIWLASASTGPGTPTGVGSGGACLCAWAWPPQTRRGSRSCQAPARPDRRARFVRAAVTRRRCQPPGRQTGRRARRSRL